MRIYYYKNSLIGLFLFAIFIIVTSSFESHGYSSSVSIVDQKIFQDLKGDWNLIGSAKNQGVNPVEVTIAVNINKSDDSSVTLKNSTFANIVYPNSAAPFKFIIKEYESFEGLAYINAIREVMQPFFFTLTQNYSNLASGDEKALVGTVKNIGYNKIEDVTVYASVHSLNGTQVDSVKSNKIKAIDPGEQIQYKILPDPAIKRDVYYYSCAGLDIDSPNPTLDLGNGEFLAFNLESASAVSSLRYDNSSDSMIFEIMPYDPEGGDLVLKLPQRSLEQKINLSLDGKPYKNTIIKMDGKTIVMKVFIPQDKHEVKISGINDKI